MGVAKKKFRRPAEPGQHAGATVHRAKLRREDLKPGDCLCNHCPAKCCRYFALPLDTPDTWKEFDYMRWFLLHEGATVFCEDGAWYLLVYSACRHLRDDNLCGTYPTRPNICREYTTDNCEYDDTWVYERYIELPEQVEEFAEALMGPRRRQGLRSPKPDPLKIVSA
jgi:uncharacterized protein